jgi:hypothetical protein
MRSSSAKSSAAFAAARVQPEELHVEHVGEPGERVPVRHVRAEEGPGGSLQGEALAHDLISEDVGVVVAVDELEATHTPVEEHHDQREPARQQPPRTQQPLPPHQLPSCTRKERTASRTDG